MIFVGKKGRVALAAALIVCAPRFAGAADSLGFVLEQTGKWSVAAEGGQPVPVVTGQTVKAGDQLAAAGPDAHLTVVLLDGGRLSCPGDERCASPLKGRAAVPGAGTRLVRAISGLFSKPERYATTMSRGEELCEAVLKLRGDKIDLAALLEKLPAGRYHLVFKFLGDDMSPHDEPTISTDAEWKPGKAHPWSAKGLKPGLYSATLESGADAWVLLSSEAHYKRDTAAFAEAKKTVAGWGKDVPARGVRSFLRATLDAQQQVGDSPAK